LNQGLAELAEAYALFSEPGLQLVELLEVKALSSYGGSCYSAGSRMGPRSQVRRWSGVPLPRGSCIPLSVVGRSSDLKVEALS